MFNQKTADKMTEDKSDGQEKLPSLRIYTEFTSGQYVNSSC